MKPNIMMLTGLFVLMLLTVGFVPYAQRQGLLTSNNTERPAQDLLFLRTYTNFAWGVDCWANAIDADGYTVPLSKVIYDEDGYWYDDWSQRMQEAAAETECAETFRIPEFDLEIMYSFVNAGTPQGEPEYYGMYACDYGTDTLYLLELQPDGSYEAVYLCSHGDDAYCLDDGNIKKFCNWMIQNGYFEAWETYK